MTPIEMPATVMSGTRIQIILSQEVLERLEPVPDQQDGPPWRYQIARSLLDRAGSLVFNLPAPLADLCNRRITITVDLAQDRHWLPLVTHRLMRDDDEQAVTVGSGEGASVEQMRRNVASALRNLGETEKKAEQIAAEAYHPGDTFKEFMNRALLYLAHRR